MYRTVVSTLPASCVLQLVWLAYTTGRSIDEQVGAMLAGHARGCAEPVGGAHHHTPHCEAAVRLYGWPVLDHSPAAKAARRVGFALTAAEVELLDAGAKRSHRSREEQLGAVLCDYLRTLHARRSGLRVAYDRMA